jgi:hypothetical protein
MGFPSVLKHTGAVCQNKASEEYRCRILICYSRKNIIAATGNVNYYEF